ncbi:rhomboid family intramembrane serine protease [Streptacidiphilus monticola]
MPTCYRHPDRETGVRCSRCDRPVCPECRVDASVGFHCRDCVQGGHGEVREARTEFGGQLTRDGALVTKLLIAANVVVWALHYAKPDLASDWVLWGYGVAHGQGYRVVTSVFLHQAIWHIATNMWSLWVLGPLLESALGRVRFLALYLVSGLAGSALFLLVADPLRDSALGASGAVFGLLGATFVLFRRRGYQLGPLMGVLVVNLVATFVVTGIAWEAHVGGLVAGAATAAGFMYAPAGRRLAVQLGTFLLVAAAVLGMTLYAVAQIPA